MKSETSTTITIPDDGEARAEREKRAVALSSVLAAVLLTGMKLVVGLWTGSLGILSEAVHSGLDLVAALVTFLAVREQLLFKSGAGQPPGSQNHQSQRRRLFNHAESLQR